jgi:hypothetical protein
MNQFTFTFSLETLQIIGRGLDDLPFKLAAPVVTDINRQIKEQQDAEVQRLQDERNRNMPLPANEPTPVQ